MADGPLKTADVIRASFPPRVAVLLSPSAEEAVKQFNLTFTQLVQPFARLSTDATWQDPSGQLILPKDLSLTLVNIGATTKKPDIDAQRNRRSLSNVVGRTPPPLPTSTTTSPDEFRTVPLTGKSVEYEVSVPARTTWFDSWRRSFLKLQSEVAGSQHEFLNHFVGCILVLSSKEVNSSEDVANAVGKLSKIQQQHQYDHPNSWMLTSVLKYYLIIQDGEANDSEAEHVYQNFRTMYGGNFCHLLKLAVEKTPADGDALISNPWQCYSELEESSLIVNDSIDLSIEPVNGKVPVSEVEEAIEENIVQSDLIHPLSPDCEKAPSIVTHNGDISNGKGTAVLKLQRKASMGSSLTSQDVRRIQLCINEFVSKALLPYMERQCRNLHESILNRRGMSKSFFSATKRLFGTASKSAPSVVYATESVEILSRKLGDIYFLFGHYGGAYQLYHQLKKDFYGDAAWLYYSSALELAALSHFMMSQLEPPLAMARAFPVHYVNDAIAHYIDQCRMVDAATRCAIMCAECLKHLENHAEAAAIFIRMTSEDCDLRSALMLEQAAYCFLEMKSPRKFALHSVLAGYRYAKAGLKSHSLNCYLQSYQIYNGRGWRFAEDHVNFTIARLQNVLQIPHGITKHLMATLVPPSPQPPMQMQTFYKEFLSTMMNMKPNVSPQSNLSRWEFFVPQIKFLDMQIRIAVTDLPLGVLSPIAVEEDTSSSTNWDSLEETVVKECIRKSSVISFKPTRLSFSRNLDNTVHPTVPCDEQFFIEIPVYNPLKIALSMRDISPKFDHSDKVEVNSIPSLELEPEESKSLRFGVTSHHVGMITLETVEYSLETLGSCVMFEQKVNLKGPRLNNTKAERFGKIYGKDLRNKIVITEKLPLLQAKVSGLPASFFHAQTANFDIFLEDKSSSSTLSSSMTISKIILAAEDMENTLQILPSNSEAVDNNNCNSLPLPVPPTTGKNYSQIVCEKDNPPPVTKISCLYKAPQSGESAALDVLIVYEISSNESPSKSKSHRIIRLSIKIPLSPAVHIEYSSLKMLDASTYLGLLRLYNLTVDYNVVINRIFFTPPEVILESICSTAKEGVIVKLPLNEKDIVTLHRNESRNIVVRFNDLENIKRDVDLLINVQWQINSSSSSNETLALGSSRLSIFEAVKSIESSFVFQVKHENSITGNFTETSLAYCDVELKLHSRVSGNFTIQLENNPPKEDITALGPSLRASGDIFLVGKTSWKVQLECMKTEILSYTVAVGWPGVYNAAPNIVVTDDKNFQETYSLHSPITVAQSPLPNLCTG